MSRTAEVVAALLVLNAGGVVACSSSGAFSEGGPPSNGTGSATGGTAGYGGLGGSSSSSSGGGGTSAGGSSSNGGSSATGGAGGGAPTCAHELCKLGQELDPQCDPCVQTICQHAPHCCNDQWDYDCINLMPQYCSTDCGSALDSCSTQYGKAYGFVDCEQASATCTFGASVIAFSCSDYCSSNGGECLAAFNNSGQCGLAEAITCTTKGMSTVICICSRGCGVAPACTQGTSCTNGQCL